MHTTQSYNNHFGQVGELGLITPAFRVVVLSAKSRSNQPTCPSIITMMRDITLKKIDAEESRQTIQSGLDGLKYVKFDPDNLTLLVNIGYWYEVDLEECRNSAKLLDWIFQVAGKLEMDGAEILWELLRALNLVSRLVFEKGVQGAFCPFGFGYEVDWKSGERREGK